MAISIPTPQTRQRLSSDALYKSLKARFDSFTDHRPIWSEYRLGDTLQSAFAMFILKDPSLLAFQDRRPDKNIHNLFHISNIPSDTQMRVILDDVDPEDIRPVFNDVFRELQRGKVLESYVFYRGAYLMPMDATGYFSSDKVHCPSCQEKVNSKTGKITYEHQMLAAILVHPDHKEVFPLAPEPIQKQDGDTKNDCERNAGKRLLEKIRTEHPHLKLIVVEDGLASNAPHIRLVQSLDMHFILGAKPGDHAYLFQKVDTAFDDGSMTTLGWQGGKVRCEISFVNDLALNESNQDLRVNYMYYAEYNEAGEVTKCFSWVTDLTVTTENVKLLVRGARARWKIENETFNTLKNQGYHYEHNFGHGVKNLSVNFAMLMMLAFLVDQVQQHCCPLFKAVLAKKKTKRSLWESLRSHFQHFTFRSMQHLYEVMLHDLAKNIALPELNTS